MTRSSEWLAYLVTLAAVASCVAWITAWRAAIPELWSWRRDLGMEPLVFHPDDHLLFENAPNLVLLRWMRLGPIDASWRVLGQGAFLGCALAVALWLGVLALARRSLRRGPCLAWVGATTALLVFTPALGGTWLVDERFRVLAPACGVVWGALLLTGGTAWRCRLAAAALLSMLVALVDETGVWCWVALAPVVAVEAHRRQRRVAASLAPWILVGNVVSFFSRLDGGIPSRMDVTDGGAWTRFAEAAGQAFAGVPGVDPSIAGGVLIGLIVVGWATIAARRGAVVAAGPWVALGLFGGLSAAHASGRLSEMEQPAPWLSELHPGLLLLPLGAAGVIATTGALRRKGTVVLALAGVVFASSWPTSFAHLRQRAENLGQAHAMFLFAQAPEQSVSIEWDTRIVRAGTDLMWLMQQGAGRRLRPFDSFQVSAFTLGEPADGEMASVVPGSARGWVRRGTFVTCPDLVAVSVLRDGSPEQVIRAARPRESGDALDWSIALPQLDVGTRLRAWGFDARSRTLRPLAGEFQVMADGRIEEAGP